MLGILLLILMGVAFHRLVQRYKQPNSWMYILLAILVWIVGGFAGAGILALINPNVADSDPGVLVIVLIASGTVATITFYQILKNYFRKLTAPKKKRDDLLD